jgi:CRISPR/Cas system CSM-associated protein Csm4 (group 5 of RAMP superfamily)
MIISMRTLKKEMKKKVNKGTYISSNTYEEIEKYMKHRLDEVIHMTIKEYENSSDKKMNDEHAKEAILNIFYGDKNDVERVR